MNDPLTREKVPVADRSNLTPPTAQEVRESIIRTCQDHGATAMYAEKLARTLEENNLQGLEG